jgi:hypothetical protein
MQFYDSSDIPTDLAQRSFAAAITHIMPNGGAPLFALSGYAQKVTAKQIEHGYWTKTMIFPKVVINGAHLSSATTLTVDDTSQIVANTVLRHQPAYGGSAQTHSTMAENILVTDVVNATTLTVTRGFAGTTAQAIADDAVLVGIGTAHEQGSNAPSSMAIIPARSLNNVQIFRNAWDITGTLAAIKMEMGYNTVSENRQDCTALHAQDIEKAAFFSVKSSGTLNNRPLYTMDGIERLIYNNAPTNLKEAGATTTFDQLESYLDPTLDYVTDAMNGNVRTIFCGSGALAVINKIGILSGTYQLQSGQTSFGLQFKQFKTTRGTFNLIEHPLFNTNDDWKKMAISMDLSSFDFAYLEGRDTFHTDINTKGHSTNGKDAEGGVLTSELTVQLKNPFACGIIYNLRAAA